MKNRIKSSLFENIEIKKKIIESQIGTIIEITDVLIKCVKRGGKVILFGNGGSAADSQHIAAEFMGRFKKDRRALAAIALTTNTSVLTSLANDYGYDCIFARQLEGLARKEDVVIGISTSGNAKNVLEGITLAKKKGIKTIGLTGAGGGRLARLADISLIVPSKDTARVQEAHITVGHIVCELTEEALCR